MSFFRKLHLSGKFIVFGSLITFMLMLATLVAYQGMSGTNERVDRFVNKYQALALTVSEIYAEGLQAEQALRNVILNSTDEKALSNYRKASEKILGLQKEAVILSKGVKEYDKQLQMLPTMWQENSVIKEEIIALAREGKQVEAIEMLIKKETPKWREVKTLIIAMQDALRKDMKAEHSGLNAFLSRTFSLTVATLCVTILLVIIMLLIFWRVMHVSFNESIARLNTLASGDLTARFDIASHDEFGQLMVATKTMSENLHRIICQVSDTSSRVAEASAQLHMTADRTATGAEDVAAQAGTVATAGEEMSATSADIAQNCQLAAEGAQHASLSAQNGAEVVDKTVSVMIQIAERVHESARTVEGLGVRSDQIGAIIGTIEDIADQTNLLALNAAIEAARAGEQGRGFAVVADEVRALAERTTSATHEIGEMIKAIQSETKGAVAAMEQGVHQVEAGTREAAKSGEALRDILEQISSVAMQVNQIATAAEQQTATTREISNNMMQITEVVQDTAGGAHESATAAHQLNGNAEELQRLVHMFTL